MAFWRVISTLSSSTSIFRCEEGRPSEAVKCKARLRRYIGRRGFVQGETALDGSGDVIAVEVDLAPSLTLQTEASPGIREGIGLKWRRDY